MAFLPKADTGESNQPGTWEQTSELANTVQSGSVLKSMKRWCEDFMALVSFMDPRAGKPPNTGPSITKEDGEACAQ